MLRLDRDPVILPLGVLMPLGCLGVGLLPCGLPQELDLRHFLGLARKRVLEDLVRLGRAIGADLLRPHPGRQSQGDQGFDGLGHLPSFGCSRSGILRLYRFSQVNRNFLHLQSVHLGPVSMQVAPCPVKTETGIGASVGSWALTAARSRGSMLESFPSSPCLSAAVVFQLLSR